MKRAIKKIRPETKSGDYTVHGSIPKDALIRSHSVIYSGVRLGKGFQCGHGVLIRESTKIGDQVSIGSGSVVEHHVVIGNRVRVHSLAFIPEFTKIEDDVWIGPKVCLTNAQYPNSPGAKKSLKGPTLQRGCIIGANATILPGVKIGPGAVVGAGSVVVKNVSSGDVVVGNPARVVNHVSKIPEYRHLLKWIKK